VAHNALRQTFTVPATGGQYAPEVMDIGAVASAGGLLEFSALVEQLPATATVELWLPGVNQASSMAAKSLATAVGLVDMVSLANWPGAQIKVKSGGTSGTGIVSVRWND